MIFNIGPWPYRVRIVRDLRWSDGRSIMGRCDMDRAEIQIDAAVEPHVRASILFHELRHAWSFHFPKPHNEEEEADFSATIQAATMADMKAQGGLAALAGLLPPDAPTPIPLPVIEPRGGAGRRVTALAYRDRPTAPASAGRAECGVCGFLVADGSIHSSPAKFDPVAKDKISRRTMYCPHCDHLQIWDEGVNLYGLPNGAVVRGPLYERGEAVERFLAAHEEAAGVA